MSWRRMGYKMGLGVLFRFIVFLFFFCFFLLIPSMIPKHILEDREIGKGKEEAYVTNMILNFGGAKTF